MRRIGTKLGPEPTLNEVLHSLCITHRRTDTGYQHEYLDHRGRVIFQGTVTDMWEWLARHNLHP